MANLFLRSIKDPAEDRPVLQLSGPALASSLQRLVDGCEAQGGIEKFARALQAKSGLFQDTLGEGKAERLLEPDLLKLSAFMATCRRRIARPLGELGFDNFREAIAELLEGASDTSTADRRMSAFVGSFPDGKAYRWVRDLGAEVLHNVAPEQYPLMTRWVWDVRANNGVIREIWHGENVDHMVIDVADDFQTFIVLREELSQFLTDNGVFRDMLAYVDLLTAQIYADYISAQGGAFLRTDFASEVDPLEHTRRILGLDGVDAKTGRSRLKTIDGDAHVIDDQKYLAEAKDRTDADT